MFYAIVTAVNDSMWETRRNNIKEELAGTLGYISKHGMFVDKFGFLVYVNPSHIVSIEVTEE